MALCISLCSYDIDPSFCFTIAMMKNGYLILLILSALLLVQCARQHKVTYDIPSNYPEARKQQIIEIFNRGKELFKVNCSECHGIFTKGKEKVPDFTNEQMDNYSARFLGGDPKNHAVASGMTAEELNDVLMFLRFKKTNKKDTTAAAKK